MKESSIALRIFCRQMSYFNLAISDICRHFYEMPANKLPALSSSEQAIMDHIWQFQPVGLNDLLTRVNATRTEPVTRATLQTQLTRLESKGWLRRDDSARAHFYSATVPADRGRRGILADLKQRLFGGSGLALVRCLVESGEISAHDLDELRRLVSQSSKPETGAKAKP